MKLIGKDVEWKYTALSKFTKTELGKMLKFIEKEPTYLEIKDINIKEFTQQLHEILRLKSNNINDFENETKSVILDKFNETNTERSDNK